jgi:hypothetical protein
MFRPNWQDLGVQVVMVKDSAAHCNAGFFPPIVVASDCFGYILVSLGCMWLLLVLYDLLVVSRASKNIQGSRSSQQTIQNQNQPRATQGHSTEATTIGEIKLHYGVSSRILNHNNLHT